MSTVLASAAIEKILSAGNQAPSGENCQPWHFVVNGLSIAVHLLPERDTSAYGWGHRASYFACGAAIENMVIAAAAQEYVAQVNYFPDPTNQLLVATLTLIRDLSVVADPLVSAISVRSTNRKPYESAALTAAQRMALVAAAAHEGFGTFLLTEDRDSIVRLARVGSTNEEIMLANKQLHSFFFSHINWTLKEDTERTVGFYIKTLELPFPAQLMFKALRYWVVMRVLRRFDFQRVVAAQNALTNASSAAMGGLRIPDVAPLSFVRAGRVVERVWLTATQCGLSFQPLTGILFFKLLLERGDSSAFSGSEQQRIESAYAAATALLGAGDHPLVFMFRVGHAAPPSARASRFSLHDAITIVETP